MLAIERQMRPRCIGVRGPAGSGKTRLIEQLIPRLCMLGVELAVITHDRVEEENVLRLRRGGLIDPARVLTQDALGPDDAWLRPYAELSLILIESDGDYLSDPRLLAQVDHWLFVVDAARASGLSALTFAADSGEYVRRTPLDVATADVSIITKIDLAPFLGVDLAALLRGLETLRGRRPTLLTNCESGDGVDAVASLLLDWRAAVP